MPSALDRLLYLADLCTPWCIRVVVTLKVADQLTDGPADIGDLADAVGCDADALGRVMSYLSRVGVFSEIAPGTFANGELSTVMLDSPARLALDLNAIGGRFATAWQTLLEVVRSGESRYQGVFGKPFWDDLDAHPEIASTFDSLMGPAGKGHPSPNVLLTGGWDQVREVVDVGGGTGSLLVEILRAWPSLTGTLVDLPRTVARSVEVFEAAGVADRVRLAGQSFFDPLPAGADLYLLHSVLNDWPDAAAVRILRRCAEAVRPGGRVVILPGIVQQEGTGDLLMMVLFGGKYRTPAELAALACSAGLTVTVSGRSGAGLPAVECQLEDG